MAIVTGQQITAADAMRLMQCFTTNYLRGNASPDLVSTDAMAFISSGGTTFALHIPGSPHQTRLITGDYAAADSSVAFILEGAYLYALLRDDGAPALRVYRYDKTNLAAGGTLMTIVGQAFSTTAINSVAMSSNGAGTFYFTAKAGNSASVHIVSKYTLSGTNLTYVSDVTCGSTSNHFAKFVGVDSSGNIYGYAAAVDDFIRKFNSSGTLQATSALLPSQDKFYKMSDYFYQLANGGVAMQFYQRIDLPT